MMTPLETARLAEGLARDAVEAPFTDPLALLPSPAIAGSSHGPVFARMGRNIGWLLGGRGFAGVVSVAYLAIAARGLGPTVFGTFALILAYGSSIAGLAQFESWQAVIRYGSTHVARRRPDRLARMLGFSATLDLGSALVGAVLAALGVKLAAPLFAWSIQQQHGAALFAAILLLSSGSTATGLLRLSDRFDLLAYTEAVGPAVRLVGALIAWVIGADLNTFLAVWAAAALLECAAGWLAAMTLPHTRLTFGRAALSAAVAENPRLWAFVVQTNLSSSLSLLWQQLGTLAVGAVGGAPAAGAFRIAGKLAGALAKPVETVTRVLYPELARLTASNNRPLLWRVSVRMTWIGSSLALVMVVVSWLAGPVMLRIFGGNGFAFAEPYLLLLTIAGAIDLCGVALEPILNAQGRSGTILGARIVGAIIYIVALGITMPTIGAIGAALAAIASSVVIRGVLARAAVRSWRAVDPS